MANVYAVLRTRLQDVNRPIVCSLDDEEDEPREANPEHDWVALELFVGFIIVLTMLCNV